MNNQRVKRNETDVTFGALMFAGALISGLVAMAAAIRIIMIF